MIFWLFISAIALVLVIGAVIAIREDGDVFVTAVTTSMVIGFVGLLVCGVGATNNGPGAWHKQQTWSLRALVTQQETSSHAGAVFFLGFGGASSSSNEVKSISYIRTASDGGSTLQKSDIEDAVIYEDGAEKPRVEDWVLISHSDGIWVPWSITNTLGTVQHRFHIPAGSILQSYEVKP